MLIDIQDETKKLHEEVEGLLLNVLESAGKKHKLPKDTELSVTFVSKERIQSLNESYRGIDRPTDVLSFPLLEASEIKALPEEMPLALGDIVIAYDIAVEQAASYGHSLEREICFLAVHGFLHLLGYTHDTVEEEKRMFSQQEEILKEFYLERPSS